MKITKQQARNLYIKLSWKILEAKYAYYYPNECSIKAIPDEKYDKMESNYKKLCKLLKVKPTASDCVGFPKDKPSCKLIMSKLGTK